MADMLQSAIFIRWQKSKKMGSDTRLVTMSNGLIRAGHGLTLAEKRLVATGVSKLDSRTMTTLAPRTRVTAAEFAETFGLDINTAYEQLASAGKQLYNRSITFYEAAHKRNGKPLPPTRITMRWVGDVRYQTGEGWIELGWHSPLLPHLLGLRKQFTSYALAQATALRSASSWRLLELLMRFKSTGWAEYTIEDFCESMEATAKQREDFAAIRRKIIEPAVRELSAKGGWLIDWKPIKANRKVVAVRFDFKRNPQQNLF